MPGKIKVKILAGRNLPVMDRSGDTTDAYVELKFGNVTFKTDVCRKSLNPQWNSEWYRFEVDDAELQDEPLQIRLMDHDTYSANDAIGKVYINLNPLLLPGVPPTVRNIWTLEAAMNTGTGSQGGSVMTGWIPVYDTMHGIRGEVNITVKVELFSDFNKFRQSSCGVQFFYSPNIPYGYRTQNVHGFVEELIVSDDPEYKWIDKIRTPRASNEARQTLFFKLSGEVQRKIGLKALDLGGNAVIGYLQNFDLEGESGIVARGIGTAVTLVKSQEISSFPADNLNIDEAALACFDESVSLLPATPLHIPDPVLDARKKHILEKQYHRKHSPRTPRRGNAARNDVNPESDNEKTQLAVHIPSTPVPRLKKCANSSPALSESIIDDASVRMMLALEDFRGETSKNKLDMKLKNLKKLFGDTDSRTCSTPKLNNTLMGSKSSSTRSSLISVFQTEKSMKESSTNSKDGIAGILIKSIHNIPLNNVREVSASPASPEESGINNLNMEDIILSEETKQDNENNMQRKQVPKAMDDHDSSSEENTPTSDGEFSNDSTGYDILRDSTFSIDEEADSSKRYSRGIIHSGTFPPTKTRYPLNALLRTDSEVLPLKEGSFISLSRCWSVSQILPDTKYPLEFLSNPISKPTKVDKNIEDNNLRKENNIREIPLDKKGTLFDKTEPISCTMIESGMELSESYFSLPIATSTPVETGAPILSVEDDSEGSNKKVLLTPLLEESKPRFHPHKVSRTFSHPASVDSAHSNDADNLKTKGNEAPRRIHFRHHIHKHRHQLRHREFSYIDESEASTSAYNSPVGSEVENKPKSSNLKRTKSIHRRVSPLAQKEHLLHRRESHRHKHPLRLKIHDKNISTPVTDIEKLSKLQSSSESLAQAPKPPATPCQKQRQERMLELIRLIDTKLMIHEDQDSDNRIRKRKRDRNTKSPKILHPSKIFNHPMGRNGKNEALELNRVSSIPSNLSLSGSMMVQSRNSSSSCKSSLESIINRETFLRSRLCKSGDSRLALKELTLDESPAKIAIEMTELKPRETNFLLGRALRAASHRSDSVLDVRATPRGLTNQTNTANITHNSCVSRPSPDRRQQDESSLSPSYPLPTVPAVLPKVAHSPAAKGHPPLHRRSSDSDLSITPKGNSLGGSDRSMGGMIKASAAVLRTMNQEALEMLEYPFITMQQYPPGFIIHIGGLVSSRSVKLLERISNLEEPEGRDSWWTEIRMEVRSHARALACNVVIGYKEETSICDDVCVLNASGTAAVINLHNSSQDAEPVLLNRQQQTTVESEKSQQKSMTIKIEKNENETGSSAQFIGKVRHSSESKDHEMYNSTVVHSKCNLCHLPYSESSVPFKVNVSKCGICKRGKVPDIMFTTIELPENMPTTGRGCFIQATVCKNKKDLRGELNAKEISDCLPFLEYELHSLLLNKLKVRGMNAIFGLKLQVSVGERLIVGMGVGTAVFLTALPTPSVPQIASGHSWPNEDQLADIQKTLVDTVKKNREFYGLKSVTDIENGRVGTTSDTDESDEELPHLDFSMGTRDACVLEVDDIEDMDRVSLLMDDRPPDDFHVVNTQTIPGLEDLEIVRNLQMFTQISRAKIPSGQSTAMPSKYFARILQSVYFKLRRMVPCALCDMQFKLALPEPDEVQFMVVGMALGLGDPVKMNKLKKKIMSHSVSKDQVKKTDDSDMIFSLDVDHTDTPSENITSNLLGNSSILTPSLKHRTRSPLRTKVHTTHRHKHVPLKGRYGVDITPLSYLPGGRIERYLGNLNFFFIRESTSVRENGGLSGFTHSFVMEVLAIVRAHITALGGNAMVAFFMTQCVLLHSPHKNHGQCLINVGGDVVSVSYFADEKQATVLNC